LAFGEEHELREGEESLGVQRAQAKGWGIRNLLFPNFIAELQVRGFEMLFFVLL